MSDLEGDTVTLVSVLPTNPLSLPVTLTYSTPTPAPSFTLDLLIDISLTNILSGTVDYLVTAVDSDLKQSNYSFSIMVLPNSSPLVI